jgi:hypothetical protein
VRESTMFTRPGSGLPIEMNVFRPIIMACPIVRFLNL